MGTRFGGPIADLTLALLTEVPLVQSGRLADHISVYVRYKDDVLLVSPNEASSERVVRELLFASQEIYQIEHESSSPDSAVMLDLEIFKSERNKLAFRPFVKPSARHVPLASDSLHPPAVHLSWPVCEVARMHSRSIYSHDYASFRKQKIDRFCKCLMSPAVIQSCLAWKPTFQTQRAHTYNRNLVRIAVPYHPYGAKTLLSRIRRICDLWSEHGRSSWGLSPTISISWKKGGSPLFSKLRG